MISVSSGKILRHQNTTQLSLEINLDIYMLKLSNLLPLSYAQFNSRKITVRGISCVESLKNLALELLQLFLCKFIFILTCSTLQGSKQLAIATAIACYSLWERRKLGYPFLSSKWLNSIIAVYISLQPLNYGLFSQLNHIVSLYLLLVQ